MNINSETMVFGLVGHPVSKSLSPFIHNYAFEQSKVNACYLVFDVCKNSLHDAIKAVKTLNVKGFNVTIPHKIDIIEMLDEIDEEALLIGAVNTVKNIDGKLIGYNTDGRGFIQSLYSSKIEIINKNISLIGAGGAARAIATSMAINGVKSIQIINRTLKKAEQLAKDISFKFPNVTTSWTDMYNINTDDIDIVINCTSVGMYLNNKSFIIDPCIFNKSTVICDIVYKPLITEFLRIAIQKGYKVVNGIDMLIYQGLLSQEIWLNKKTDLVDFENLKRIINNFVE